MKKIIVIFLGIFVSSCATGPSKQELLTADFGPPPSDYEKRIKDAFLTLLIDPTAPLYKINPPVKAFRFKGIINGGGYVYGWQSCGAVNSKNRMGGYAGWKLFSAFFYGPNPPKIHMGMFAESDGC